jgi:fibronectin type 3 domain-containing protein
LVSAREVILSWDANTESDLAGYKLYVQAGRTIEPGGSQATIIYIPIASPTFDLENPRYTIDNLEDNIVYYFVVTAYSYHGFESDFSNEVIVKQREPVFNYLPSSSEESDGCLVDSLSFD